MTGSRPGHPGPYSCALAALNRARSRYEAVARTFKPRYHHNDTKLFEASPLTQGQHTAIMRQLQWRSEWIKYGEEIIRGYQHSPFDTRDGNNREVAIRECMERLSKRYRWAQGDTTAMPTGSPLEMERCRSVRAQLREWFEARMEYLQDEYRRAINDSDSIIGKQGRFDRRPTLPPR